MKKYDIAAYVWPAYCPDERAKIFWPQGIGEWQTVMSNQPKFDGHLQPRYPLWGYVDESDPNIMEMQIETAVKHGVNVFIYDWYWYDRMPFLEGCLNNGFLKANNNHKMKFYLMWANHDVNLIWDKRNSDNAFLGKDKTVIWKGALDRREFEKICKRTIELYFSHPSYYKIDRKPVYMIYSIDKLIEGLGSIGETRKALDWFRNEAVKAGHQDIELQIALRGHDTVNMAGIVADNLGTQKEIVESLGINSLTHYQFCHFIDINRGYPEILKDAENAWRQISANYTKPYYPHVSVGWDSNPRCTILMPDITSNNGPEQFQKALVKAKDYIDNHTEQAPLITINSWNEWTETSYLEPCSMYGYGYLEAIKNVFN
ncbi:MAG TPA: hypothetical protein DC057_05800 [Spirochaetia bacterium]|nr:hypothetical protein [Spirochaetia bacterium]